MLSFTLALLFAVLAVVKGSVLGLAVAIVFGVVVVILVLGVYVASGILASTRRTADAPIEVVSATPRLSTGRAAPREGFLVEYAFVSADGQTYRGEAFRTWSLDEIGAGHACYEPGNPANHELIHASVACAR